MPGKPDKPDPSEPLPADKDTIEAAWNIVTRGAAGRVPWVSQNEAVILSAVCVALLDLQKGKIDRLP